MSKHIAAEIKETPFANALSERYLSYALSTIMSRSLPDVRDGLKPVHRRLLYAMHMLRLHHDQSFKKCARVVGDVIGKFHPHGEEAVYQALVRLAQDFSVRYPLIDGQGNFGNIDGDAAAAKRYTESRLTEISSFLLRDISQDTVNFLPTYDNEDHEPAVLPSDFPNLLANGASGIAVGMATNIPPHNILELCDALLAMIAKPSIDMAELTEYVQGPDFPTGGTLVEGKAQIQKTYSTGRGHFRLRAKWREEKLKNGQWQIIVTEIPYQVEKSKLIEKIADLLHKKKLNLLADVRDESSEDVRLVFIPKNRNVSPGLLMDSLYKFSDLEIKFNLNMNVVDKHKTPSVMSLKQVLQAYLDHRHEVLLRRTTFRLEKIETRLDILNGYLIIFADLDRVIQIIREEDHPKQELMRVFTLNETQTEAILNMRLRSLHKLQEVALRKEHAELESEKQDLSDIMGNEKRQWKEIKTQIRDLRKIFSEKGSLAAIGARRTDILHESIIDKPIPVEAFIEKEAVTLLCSKKGWVKWVKGHQYDLQDSKYKDGDGPRFSVTGWTTDKVLILSKLGKIYTIPVDKLPSGRGFGEPISLHVDFQKNDEIIDLMILEQEAEYILASSDARGFRIHGTDLLAQTKTGKQALNLKSGAKAFACKKLTGDHLAIIGENRKVLIFPLNQIPAMSRGQGVILQRYKDGSLSDLTSFTLDEGLRWKNGKKNFHETDLKEWLGNRAQAGRMAPFGFSRKNKFYWE